MFPKINPLQTQSWQALQNHHKEVKGRKISDYFKADKNRFRDFSILTKDILFDFSKNSIDKDTVKLLVALANECKLEDAIKAAFDGEAVNETENRAVLHTALRREAGSPLMVNGEDVMLFVNDSREKMRNFCDAVHAGARKGFTGKKFRYIVNIGIGGSDLGPQMVTEALKPYVKRSVETFFVSNVDPAHISGVLKKIKADRTLFIIASKTFTTQETMSNALAARQWFLKHGGSEADIRLHFVAVSTNEAEVRKFGIDPENMFAFRDWVGGRYSLWGPIGLSIALSVGYRNFEKLLEGARDADAHFRGKPFSKNIPVLMALLGIWYRNFFGFSSEAILPYDQHLHRFAAYFQQGNMESNGKSIDRSGKRVDYLTGPVIWGEPGTNGQHAFYQLLHQGTDIIPCDFIAAAINHYPVNDMHEKLLSHFFAQTEALMNGRPHEDPYRSFEGNRPTNAFLVKKMTPYVLGKLIAFYEHKIFVQGVIWNIFSFDQWGVELGKELAGKILNELSTDGELNQHDASTAGLISQYKKFSGS